jgi:hypothetical protein
VKTKRPVTPPNVRSSAGGSMLALNVRNVKARCAQKPDSMIERIFGAVENNND